MCKRYTHMHTICYGHTITHQRQTREQQQPPYIREQPCSFVFILLQFVACLYPKQMYIFIYFGYRHCHTLLQCGRIHNYYLSFGPNSRKLYLIEIFNWWLCMGLACDAPSPDRNILILSETPFFSAPVVSAYANTCQRILHNIQNKNNICHAIRDNNNNKIRAKMELASSTEANIVYSRFSSFLGMPKINNNAKWNFSCKDNMLLT